MSVIEGLADGASITASWTDDRRNPLQSDISQTLNTSTTLTLEFIPLFSSHGGQYMCNASITVPVISTVKRSSEPYDIIIQSNIACIESYQYLKADFVLATWPPNLKKFT